MGHGCMPGFVISADNETVEKVVGNEKYKRFFDSLKEEDVSLVKFARDADLDFEEEYPQKVMQAYEDICKTFKEKTGLSLGLFFHDSTKEGDIYDEVDGVNFITGFDSVFKKTENAVKLEKKYEKNLGIKMFVCFG